MKATESKKQSHDVAGPEIITLYGVVEGNKSSGPFIARFRQFCSDMNAAKTTCAQLQADSPEKTFHPVKITVQSITEFE
jgi:hypothetical protein